VIICILALLQGAEFVGLSARAKAYLHNDGFEKLGLGIYFNVDDLHIPDFPRKGIKINFTIISTEIPVPAVVRKGGNPDSPDEIPCFACERDASGELSMTLV